MLVFFYPWCKMLHHWIQECSYVCTLEIVLNFGAVGLRIDIGFFVPGHGDVFGGRKQRHRRRLAVLARRNRPPRTAELLPNGSIHVAVELLERLRETGHGRVHFVHGVRSADGLESVGGTGARASHFGYRRLRQVLDEPATEECYERRAKKCYWCVVDCRERGKRPENRTNSLEIFILLLNEEGVVRVRILSCMRTMSAKSSKFQTQPNLPKFHSDLLPHYHIHIGISRYLTWSYCSAPGTWCWGYD